MIYLLNSTARQEVCIPSPTTKVAGPLRLTLKSVANNVVCFDSTIEQTENDSELYYFFDVTLSEGLNGGTYEYTLTSEDEVTLCAGLMMLTECERNYEYEKTIEYKQYE